MLFGNVYSMVNDIESLLKIIPNLDTVDYNDIVYVFISEYIYIYIYIYSFHSLLHSLFIDHCNNKLIIGTQIDYRQDPCMVEIFGGHVVCSRPCIGDLKD